MELQGKRYDTGRPISVQIEDAAIVSIQPLTQTAENLPWIAPGLADLQLNGYGGQEFNDPRLTPEKVAQVSQALDQDGVIGYCPTVTTHGFELLSHALRTIAEACRTLPEADSRILGIHLEGPYLSAEDGPRGAHPKQHCRAPDWDEFRRLQDAAEQRIRILTMSPEYENSADFIAKAADSGVLIAIGHTAADSDQIRAAVDAGARLSTHLGNGAHGQIRRHPNYIWDQLAEDRLHASLIVDGHHLPASVVKSFLRAKTPQRCLLVSDITGMGGMPSGRYQTPGLGDVEVLEDGRLVVAGQRQYLAGAALPMTVGVASVMQLGEVGLQTAIEMSSSQPLKLLGETPWRLEVGAEANLILFDLPHDGVLPPKIQIRATVRRGRRVYASV